MPSLADLPEIIGFFSYSRDDDREFGHSLTTIRTLIQNELRARLGRSRRTLRLWQDEEAIPPGAMWEGQIRNAIDQSVFFIPIITPRVLSSRYCGREFQAFLEREKQLGRNDLVFPILYIDVDELEDESKWRGHPVLEVIGTRQYVDWREYRFEPDGPALRRGVSVFSAKIVSSLRHPMSEPHPVEAKTTPMVPTATPPTDDIVRIPPVSPIAPKPAVQPAEAIVEPSPEPTPREHPSLAGSSRAESKPLDLRKWSLIAGLVILTAVGLILLASWLTEIHRTAVIPPQPSPQPSSPPPTPPAPTSPTSPASTTTSSPSPPASPQLPPNPAPAAVPSTPSLTVEICKNSKVVDKITSAYETSMKLAGQNIRFPIDYEISLPPAEFFRMCSIKFSSGLIADYMVFDDNSLHIYGCWVDGTKPPLPGAVCDQLEHKINP